MSDLKMTTCAECGSPAEVVDDGVIWESTDGPIEHVATACLADRSHQFFGPAYRLLEPGTPR